MPAQKTAVVAMLGPLVVALAGFAWGRYLESASGISLRQMAFLAGGFLGLAGLLRGSVHGGQVRLERLASAMLLGYVILAAIVEPLAFVSNESEVLVSVAWLSPLIVGAVLLPVWGSWWPGVGCWSVLFSGTAALAYDLSHEGSGVGFCIRWLA